MGRILNATSKPNFESDTLISNLIGSPWSGHRQFAYDLVNFINPKLIVELGTHYGCSFFSFAQSVKDNNLDCKLVAVDTWQGDEHAGFYNNKVYDMVNKTVKSYFSNLDISLFKCTFDEALKNIEDNSIELLHIDGFHTYEAVKHDFTTWLPKLKENGVILMHDIAEYTGYGSSVFWAELKQQYPSFEFSQSWGLGVIFPKGNYNYKKLIEDGILNYISLYEYKALYELEVLKSNELDRVSLERLSAINTMDKMISEKEETIQMQGKLLEERQEAMTIMENMILEKITTIEAQEKLLIERQEAMTTMENMISEKIEIINAQERLLKELN